MAARANFKIYLAGLLFLMVLFILFLFFLYKPENLYRPIRRFFSTHSHRTLNVHDINTIKPWMTFDYINKVFKLPSDYLKSALSISNPGYPNISLGSYAKGKNINETDFVTKVQEALHNYLSPQK